MENPGILNRRKWSPSKKGVVLGVMAGILMTGLPRLLLMIESNFFTAMLSLITFYPTSCVYHFFGWRWGVGTSSPNVGQIICAAFLINSLLLAIVGALIGGAIQWFKRDKGNHAH
jgi:hypothetical protein